MEAEITTRGQNGGSLRKGSLDNGMQLILKESRTAPVASFWIFYRVGSRNEMPGITGISHWVEHMLFKGTEKYPQGAFDKAVGARGRGLQRHDLAGLDNLFRDLSGGAD